MARITREGTDRFFDYGLLSNTRTIYLGGEIDQRTADNFLKALYILENSGDGPITIILNSEGGDVDHGFAIYDAIKNCHCEITIDVYGMAMSMASVILQAADVRRIAKHGRVMIHHGSLGLPAQHSKITYSWTESNKKMDLLTINIYYAKIRERHVNITKKEIDNLLDFDTILTGEEAVMMGLADSVI